MSICCDNKFNNGFHSILNNNNNKLFRDITHRKDIGAWMSFASHISPFCIYVMVRLDWLIYLEHSVTWSRRYRLRNLYLDQTFCICNSWQTIGSPVPALTMKCGLCHFFFLYFLVLYAFVGSSSINDGWLINIHDGYMGQRKEKEPLPICKHRNYTHCCMYEVSNKDMRFSSLIYIAFKLIYTFMRIWIWGTKQRQW